MLSAWVMAGQSEARFWRVTPRVFSAIMKGADDGRVLEAKRDTALAWRFANYRNMKRLPRLDRELKKLEPGNGKAKGLADQTPHDMLDTLTELKAAGAPMNIRFVPND